MIIQCTANREGLGTGSGQENKNIIIWSPTCTGFKFVGGQMLSEIPPTLQYFGDQELHQKMKKKIQYIYIYMKIKSVLECAKISIK